MHLKPKSRRGPLQGAVRLITREQETQQQRGLRQELGFLREYVLRELLGPLPNRVVGEVATNPGNAQSEADPPSNASKSCSPSGDKEAFIEDARVRMFKETPLPSVRLERKTTQAPPREEQPTKKDPQKRKRRRRRRQMKRAVAKGEAPGVTQQCQCTRTQSLLVGDSLVGWETGRIFSQLQPANSAMAFPSARVKKVVKG